MPDPSAVGVVAPSRRAGMLGHRMPWPASRAIAAISRTAPSHERIHRLTAASSAGITLMTDLQPLLQLAELFDHIEDVRVWVKDRDGCICWVNRAVHLLHEK